MQTQRSSWSTDICKLNFKKPVKIVGNRWRVAMEITYMQRKKNVTLESLSFPQDRSDLQAFFPYTIVSNKNSGWHATVFLNAYGFIMHLLCSKYITSTHISIGKHFLGVGKNPGIIILNYKYSFIYFS